MYHNKIRNYEQVHVALSHSFIVLSFHLFCPKYKFTLSASHVFTAALFVSAAIIFSFPTLLVIKKTNFFYISCSKSKFQISYLNKDKQDFSWSEPALRSALINNEIIILNSFDDRTLFTILRICKKPFKAKR